VPNKGSNWYGRISETASSMFMSLLLCAIAINRCFPPCEYNLVRRIQLIFFVILFAGMYYMILLFCISLIRVELVVNERKIG
jgi:hypothetical protein